jgi:hypothetical protein
VKGDESVPRRESRPKEQNGGLSDYVRGTERTVGSPCDPVAPNGASHTRSIPTDVQAVDEEEVGAGDRRPWDFVGGTSQLGDTLLRLLVLLTDPTLLGTQNNHPM